MTSLVAADLAKFMRQKDRSPLIEKPIENDAGDVDTLQIGGC